MNDLIDRQAAIKKVQAYHCRYPEYMDGFVSKVLSAIKADLVEDIEEMPTAEPKTGRWIPQDWNETIGGTCRTLVYCLPKCSICGYSAIHTNYCPNCGAYMKEENDETD